MEKLRKFIQIIVPIIVTIILLVTMFTNDAYKTPQITLKRGFFRMSHIYIPLRDNYDFSEVPYTIEETENGYNIIIHCIKEK